MLTMVGFLARVGQQRQGEAQEAVRPHLQQDAGQHHRAGGGRLGVRVGQPGVEREHRHLHGEADEEGPEDPPLHACRGAAVRIRSAISKL